MNEKSADSAVPFAVAQAALLNYDMRITGYLHRAQVEVFSLVGRVYFDDKERFENGLLIRTSNVREFVERQQYVIALTHAGSAYVLVEPYDGLRLPSELH